MSHTIVVFMRFYSSLYSSLYEIEALPCIGRTAVHSVGKGGVVARHFAKNMASGERIPGQYF